MSNVIQLNSRRRRIYTWLFCLFCHRFRAGFWHWGYAECPYCDEFASVPADKVGL